MTEEGWVHPDCRNSSNPFHQCSNYCFKIIYEAGKPLNSNGSGLTKVNDDGFAPSPIDPLSDQKGNHVDQSTLSATNNAAGDFTNLTGPSKLCMAMERTVSDAYLARFINNWGIKENQTAMVQEKTTMEPLAKEYRAIAKEKMLKQRRNKVGRLSDSNGFDTSKTTCTTVDLQEKVHSNKKWEKDPAPSFLDGGYFVTDFPTAFPPLIYHGAEGGEEIYVPPIPVKADINALISSEDVSKVGSYPDHVVLSVANERDMLISELQQINSQLRQTMKENIMQKIMYKDQLRLTEYWFAKYNAIANGYNSKQE